MSDSNRAEGREGGRGGGNGERDDTEGGSEHAFGGIHESEEEHGPHWSRRWFSAGVLSFGGDKGARKGEGESRIKRVRGRIKELSE